MGGRSDTVDARIGRLAARQFGVVARTQLRGLGVSARQVDRRVAQGRLVAVHRGVYAVGHAHLTREGTWMAALLAAGPAAALSHRSAAIAWALLPATAGERAVHVVLPGIHGCRGPAGVAVHRSRTLGPADVAVRDGLALTAPERTLEDLALGRTGERELRRMVDQAEALGLLRRPLDTTRRPRLRAALDAGPPLTRSELEDRFLALVDAHGLPRPRVNALVGAYTVDFLWPDARLVAETDGFAHHRGRDAFARDRRRDRELQVAGLRVVRFTHADVTEDAAHVAATLGALLARR
jgi:very-short-patch-repair endonuclease